MDSFIELETTYGAHNYEPLPVILKRGEGVYIWDTEGKCYLDMMSAYSAVSHGHCHPTLVKVLINQSSTLGVVSRAFYNDQLGLFLKKLCELTGFQKALPMNTGAEAVETALKAARKWGYTVKGIPLEKAEIIVCKGNFHGRTIAIVGMSSETQYKSGFGPFPEGFKLIEYGNSEALKNAITSNTAAFLVEPIQGEGGIIIPPEGYLQECASICRKNNVLFICDEIQTGLGRTGKMLACYHEGVQPDGIVLGKALGGGLLPVSAFVSRDEVMDVFTPGDHGSTFGGYPLAAAIGHAALDVLIDDNLIESALEQGSYFLKLLKSISSPLIKEVRGKGLLIGLEIDSQFYLAREICLRLLKEGILSKETHQTVVRFAPPLIITREQIDIAMEKIEKVLKMAEKDYHSR